MIVFELCQLNEGLHDFHWLQGVASSKNPQDQQDRTKELFLAKIQMIVFESCQLNEGSSRFPLAPGLCLVEESTGPAGQVEPRTKGLSARNAWAIL
ncbi:uncharacterized protein LOC144825154 isoform X2 [Lissotriton helveticus]